jgi:hypothetical protein
VIGTHGRSPEEEPKKSPVHSRVRPCRAYSRGGGEFAVVGGPRVRQPRLERFIGVIYRPESERWSHCSACSSPRQFDAYLWFDQTTAVTPLPTRQQPGPDETWPFGCSLVLGIPCPRVTSLWQRVFSCSFSFSGEAASADAPPDPSGRPGILQDFVVFRLPR